MVSVKVLRCEILEVSCATDSEIVYDFAWLDVRKNHHCRCQSSLTSSPFCCNLCCLAAGKWQYISYSRTSGLVLIHSSTSCILIYLSWFVSIALNKSSLCMSMISMSSVSRIPWGTPAGNDNVNISQYVHVYHFSHLDRRSPGWAAVYTCK